MEREKGIEPSLPAWKAGVLPLNYSRVALLYDGGQRRIRTSVARCATDLQSVLVDRLSICPLYVSMELRKLAHRLLLSWPIGKDDDPRHTARKTFKFLSWREASNPRPADYKSAALPTELRQRSNFYFTERMFIANFHTCVKKDFNKKSWNLKELIAGTLLL